MSNVIVVCDWSLKKYEANILYVVVIIHMHMQLTVRVRAHVPTETLCMCVCFRCEIGWKNDALIEPFHNPFRNKISNFIILGTYTYSLEKTVLI